MPASAQDAPRGPQPDGEPGAGVTAEEIARTEVLAAIAHLIADGQATTRRLSECEVEVQFGSGEVFIFGPEAVMRIA